MDEIAPYLLPVFQYKPRTTGQTNTDSNPPNEKRLSHTNRLGGFRAIIITAKPIKPVTIKLRFLISRSVAFGLIKFK